MPKVRKETPELENWCMSKKEISPLCRRSTIIFYGFTHFLGINERCKSSLSCEESCPGQYRDCG